MSWIRFLDYIAYVISKPNRINSLSNTLIKLVKAEKTEIKIILKKEISTSRINKNNLETTLIKTWKMILIRQFKNLGIK